MILWFLFISERISLLACSSTIEILINKTCFFVFFILLLLDNQLKNINRKKIIICSALALMACFPACGQDANDQLSNLQPTNINQSLIPLDCSLGIGSPSKSWGDSYLCLNRYWFFSVISSNEPDIRIGLIQGGSGVTPNLIFNSGSDNLVSTATANTFIGTQSGRNAAAATNNSFFGSNAGEFNTDGDFNSFLGSFSGHHTTTGSRNTAVGFSSLLNNIAGGYNTAVGYQALMNTGMTLIQGQPIVKGNTALGYMAGALIDMGSGNTCLGENSGHHIVDGFSNVTLGALAAPYLVSGYDNICIGVQSAPTMTTGRHNVVIGSSQCGSGITTGGYNTIIGSTASTISKVEKSTALGYGAIVSMSRGMALGKAGGADYCLKWGFAVDPEFLAENVCMQVSSYGNTTNGNGAYLSTGGDWANPSSRDLKEMFIELNSQDILEKISSLEMKQWKYKQNKAWHIGPIAEDFYEAFGLGLDNKSISTIDPAGVALVGVQALYARVEELKKETEEMTAVNEAMREKMESMEKALMACCVKYSTPDNTQKAELKQNQPNPFNQKTLINYALPIECQKSELQVYNLNGELVSISQLQNDSSSIEFDANTFAQGIYAYTLIVDGVSVDTKQMIVTR
ncbi:MAG: tail fiber domain-containing protein [Flavobacteriales bacterium]